MPANRAISGPIVRWRKVTRCSKDIDFPGYQIMKNTDGIQIQVNGLPEVRKMLKEIVKQYGDASKPLSVFGEYKLLSLREQWDREENPYGQKWKKLAPATIEEKRRNNKMLGILTRDGVLKGSFTYSITNNLLTIGTNVRYAPYHQFGQGVPKRQMLGLNDEDIRKLKSTITEYRPINK